MANKNAKLLERELNENFRELLLNMDKKEFEEYFKHLIKKYYEILFTFENNYSKYYEDSNKQYDKTIKLVKDLTGFQYNNLDNFENLERLKQAEEIAYNYMNELHFMEKSYSNIIYHNALQEVIFFNSTFKNLLKLYKNNPSEDILSVIRNTLAGTEILFKDVEKLPLTEATSLEEIEETVEFKKEHLKKLSEKEKAEVPETFTFNVFKVPIFSLELKVQLEKFYSILEYLEKILPEDVKKFKLKINSSEKIDFLNLLLETKSEEESEEDIYKTVAYLDYIKEENKAGKNYLYTIIDSWS